MQCENCNALFNAFVPDVKKGMGRFCSQACYGEWCVSSGSRKGPNNGRWEGGVSVTARKCECCGKGFTVKTKVLSRKRSQAAKFCSNKCYWGSHTDQRFPRTNFYKSGRREDLKGIFFRSSWEANWARYLNFLIEHREIISWRYEPKTFWFDKIKRGVRSYTPDFEITAPDGSVFYHEVKGYMDQRSRTKLKRMRIYYPEVRIELVDRKRYQTVKRQLSSIIKTWE
jgi:hypothetical protein